MKQRMIFAAVATILAMLLAGCGATARDTGPTARDVRVSDKQAALNVQRDLLPAPGTSIGTAVHIKIGTALRISR